MYFQRRYISFTSGIGARHIHTERQHVIFYAKNLEKAHQWLIHRGVAAQPVTADSGGNRFFRFEDLEGNAIEVCVEP